MEIRPCHHPLSTAQLTPRTYGVMRRSPGKTRRPILSSDDMNETQRRRSGCLWKKHRNRSRLSTMMYSVEPSKCLFGVKYRRLGTSKTRSRIAQPNQNAMESLSPGGFISSISFIDDRRMFRRGDYIKGGVVLILVLFVKILVLGYRRLTFAVLVRPHVSRAMHIQYNYLSLEPLGTRGLGRAPKGPPKAPFRVGRLRVIFLGIRLHF